jgi:chitinase
MQTKNYLLLTICLALGMLALISCSKQLQNEKTADPLADANAAQAATGTAATVNTSLVAYKNSPHQLFYAYCPIYYDTYDYGSGKDITTRLDQVPDSVDIVALFSNPSSDTSTFWTVLKNTYIPNLHAKGTKIVRFCPLPKTVSAFTVNYPNNSTGWAKWASDTVALYSTYGYDGAEVDIEPGSDDGTAATQTLQENLIMALSKYYGPKSGNSATLLNYDTDDPASYPIFLAVYSYVNYVIETDYFNETTASKQSFYNGYANYIKPSQWIPGVNYEDGSGDAGSPRWVYQLASWQPTQGTKGGVAAWGTNSNYHANNYNVTDSTIQIMNPAGRGSSGSSTGIVSGSNYRIVAETNNSSVLDVTNGGTASGTFVELYGYTSGNTAEEWTVVSLGNGYFKLEPLNAPTMALSVAGTANYSQAVITTYSGATSQQWQILSVGGGYYSLEPANASTMRLDVNAAGTANGTKIQIYTSNGTPAQKFEFVKS